MRLSFSAPPPGCREVQSSSWGQTPTFFRLPDIGRALGGLVPARYKGWCAGRCGIPDNAGSPAYHARRWPACSRSTPHAVSRSDGFLPSRMGPGCGGRAAGTIRAGGGRLPSLGRSLPTGPGRGLRADPGTSGQPCDFAALGLRGCRRCSRGRRWRRRRGRRSSQ